MSKETGSASVAIVEQLYAEANARDAKRLSDVIVEVLATTRQDRNIDDHGNFTQGGITFTSNPSGKV